MPEILPQARRVADNRANIGVGGDRAGRAEREVHVVWQEHHAAIWAHVKLGVVLAIGAVVVSSAREDAERHASQPVVDVHVVLDAGVERCAGEIEMLAVAAPNNAPVAAD